jgi:hypothetical protein
MSGQTVHLEPIVFQGRIYAEGKKYPEEYEGAFTVTVVNGTAYVSGLTGKVTMDGYRDFQMELKAYEIESYEFARMEDGLLRVKIHRNLTGE